MVKNAHKRSEQEPPAPLPEYTCPTERLAERLRMEEFTNPCRYGAKVDMLGHSLGLIRQFIYVAESVLKRVIRKKFCTHEERSVWTQVVGDDVPTCSPRFE